MQIKKTTDYKKFGFYKSNRRPSHFGMILKSIEDRDLTMYRPILCSEENGKFMIIDGQNRFLACKELNKPIYYQVGDLTEMDIIPLNTNQKNLSMEEYLNFWCSQRKHSYLKLRNLVKDTGFQVGTLIRLFKRDGNYSSVTVQFKNGGFEYFPEEEKDIMNVSRVYHLINEIDPGHAVRSLTPALRIALRHFDVDRLCQKIEKFPFMLRKQGDSPQYQEMLQDIYNYSQKSNDRVYIPKR